MSRQGKGRTQFAIKDAPIQPVASRQRATFKSWYKGRMMKKTLMAIFLIVATTLPAMAANDNPGGKRTPAEEQVTHQQDLKRKEVLDGMQLQAQQLKQQQQQQNAEIQRQQDLINQENRKSSGKK